MIVEIVTHFFFRRQGASAGKLQVKAARIPPIVKFARSKQYSSNRGHNAQHLHRPQPASTQMQISNCMHTPCIHLSRFWLRRFQRASRTSSGEYVQYIGPEGAQRSAVKPLKFTVTLLITEVSAFNTDCIEAAANFAAMSWSSMVHAALDIRL